MRKAPENIIWKISKWRLSKWRKCKTYEIYQPEWLKILKTAIPSNGKDIKQWKTLVDTSDCKLIQQLPLENCLAESTEVECP
jgi:hypothetical protein